MDGVIQITEIRVTYHFNVPESHRAEVERAFAHHPKKCPAYMSVKDAIRIVINENFTWQ